MPVKIEKIKTGYLCGRCGEILIRSSLISGMNIKKRPPLAILQFLRFQIRPSFPLNFFDILWRKAKLPKFLLY
jgi:hypothetical protein